MEDFGPFLCSGVMCDTFQTSGQVRFLSICVNSSKTSGASIFDALLEEPWRTF